MLNLYEVRLSQADIEYITCLLAGRDSDLQRTLNEVLPCDRVDCNRKRHGLDLICSECEPRTVFPEQHPQLKSLSEVESERNEAA